MIGEHYEALLAHVRDPEHVAPPPVPSAPAWWRVVYPTAALYVDAVGPRRRAGAAARRAGARAGETEAGVGRAREALAAALAHGATPGGS